MTNKTYLLMKIINHRKEYSRKTFAVKFGILNNRLENGQWEYNFDVYSQTYCDHLANAIENNKAINDWFDHLILDQSSNDLIMECAKSEVQSIFQRIVNLNFESKKYLTKKGSAWRKAQYSCEAWFLNVLKKYKNSWHDFIEWFEHSSFKYFLNLEKSESSFAEVVILGTDLSSFIRGGNWLVSDDNIENLLASPSFRKIKNWDRMETLVRCAHQTIDICKLDYRIFCL